MLLRTCLLLVSCLFVSMAIADEGAVKMWASQGFDPSYRQSLVDHLEQSVESGAIPGGSMLLIRQDQELFRQAFGYGHLRLKRPFRSDDSFRIASISKPIIATLIVKLAADSVVDLDQPIDRYLPAVGRLKLANGKPPISIPTLRQCLKHTAGFSADSSASGRPWLKYTGQGLTLAEVVDRELAMPVERSPGRRFAYSGIGYDIAGRVVEVVTGRLLHEVLRDELLVPLGMKNTTYHPDKTLIDAMPSFYWRWSSDGNFRRRIDAPPIPEGDYVSVGGAMISTLDDLRRFMGLHRDLGQVDGQTIIPAESITAMYRRERPGSFYGLGFTLGENGSDGLPTWISHTGSSGTYAWLDRKRSVVGIIVTQQAISDRQSLPKEQKVLSPDDPTWQKQTKTDFIDPILGWGE
jgi:CubicO group peptidase (beta-lactamase class C family)